MTTENTKEPEAPNALEDLTVSETETADVKGGAANIFLGLLPSREAKGE